MIKNKIQLRNSLQSGFTLIELLIVIAIIGILAAFILVNLGGSKASSRNAKRLDDIKQISTAMQLYFNDNSGFPGPGTASTTGPTPTDGNPAWTTYLLSWPNAPMPADNPNGASDCTSPSPGTGTNQYTYTQVGGGADYSVTFCLGATVGNYGPGMHTLTSNGIQ